MDDQCDARLKRRPLNSSTAFNVARRTPITPSIPTTVTDHHVPLSPDAEPHTSNGEQLQSIFSRSPTSGHVYPFVHLNGNSQAIFGNVGDSSSSFFRNNPNEVSKRLLLSALYFEGMQSRRNQIAARAGSPRYIEWVWTTSFNTWLHGPDSFYWITGCPGSGKSTLMKHISESRKTLTALQANGGEWTPVHFFFDFRAKVGTANTIEGMLRSLLYQIAKRLPEVANHLESTLLVESLSEGDLHDYMNNLCDAIQQTSTRICAFIDGLDEFAGPGSDLLEAIYSLEDRSGIKICMASRPYPVFEDSLSRYQHLVMQDHNDESIQLYTEAQFKSSRIVGVASLPHQLADKVRKQARGVFLWARLATDQLLRDLLAGKSITELEWHLGQMPQEVQEMYQRILDRLPEVLKIEAALLLYILTVSNENVEIRKLFIAMQTVASKLSTSHMMHPVDEDSNNAYRLLALLGDFVDVSTGDVKPETIFTFGRARVRIRSKEAPILQTRLTHETLYTYLTDSKWLESILSPHLTITDGPRFWFNLYLDELLECLERCVPLSSTDLKKYRSLMGMMARRFHDPASNASESDIMIDSLLGEMISPDSEANTEDTKNLSTARHDRLDKVQAEVIELLELWRGWTPLLPYALQEIFMGEYCGVEHSSDERIHDMQKVLQSSVSWLHRLICVFQGVEFLEKKFIYTGPYSAWGSCSENMRTLALLSPHVSVPLCHGMSSCLTQSFCKDSCSPAARQPLCDTAWRMSVTYGGNRSREGPMWRDLLLLLVRPGDLPVGKFTCEVLRMPPEARDLPLIFDSLKSQMDSQSLLSEHQSDCEFYGSLTPEAGFLCHWADRTGTGWADEDITALFETLLIDPKHLSQIATPAEGPLLNFILERFIPHRRMLKFVLALQAGANPYIVGRSGTAFEVAKRELHVKKRWLHDLSYEVLKREALQMEKIVELLEYYASHDGQLPRDLDGFLKFDL